MKLNASKHTVLLMIRISIITIFYTTAIITFLIMNKLVLMSGVE